MNCTASPAALYYCQSRSNKQLFFKTITKKCPTPRSKFNAIIWEIIEIRAAAGHLMQSHGLRYRWNHVERPLNRLFRTKKKHFLRGFMNCNHQHIKIFSRLVLSARNTISQSAQPGNRVIFLTRPKPNVSRLRWPGAIRAQPCIDNEPGHRLFEICMEPSKSNLYP